MALLTSKMLTLFFGAVLIIGLFMGYNCYKYIGVNNHETTAKKYIPRTKYVQNIKLNGDDDRDVAQTEVRIITCCSYFIFKSMRCLNTSIVILS